MKKENLFPPAHRLLRPVLACLIVFALCIALPVCAADYHRIVAISDIHASEEYRAVQERAIGQINEWNDVTLVAALGDLCRDMGSEEEYEQAKMLFSKLKKPFCPIVGNHDYIYGGYSNSGARVKAMSHFRKEKLIQFQKAFGLDRIYYTKELGPYLLVFLSVDHLTSGVLTELSNEQLSWFEEVLKSNSKRPTIVFFHGPLKGTTLGDRSTYLNHNYFAQPHERIRPLLLKNAQVFLWVSGHIHMPANSPSFLNDVNKFEGLVTNIHTPNMNRKTIWSISLYLHPDHVLVRTFDHNESSWLEKLDRKIPLPAL